MTTPATPASFSDTTLWRALVAVLSGMAMALAYAPFSIWAGAMLGVAGFTWTMYHAPSARQRAWLGYLFGLVLFGVTVSYVGVMGWWVGLAIVLVMALWTMGLGLLHGPILRLRAWPIWAAATWITMEWAYSRFPFGGFGWDRLGFTTINQPMGGYLWILSVSGTGFLVAVAGTAMTWLSITTSQRQRLAILGGLAVLLVGGAALGAMPLSPAGQQVKVGVVQGNVDGSAGPHTMGYAHSVTNNHLSETITLMAKVKTGLVEEPDFIAWPENSTDNDPRDDQPTRHSLELAYDYAQRPIMVGAVMVGPEEGYRQTSMLWWTDAGIEARYNKQNAVPFGEFTPMRDLVFALVPMAKRVGLQTMPGTEPGAIEVSVPTLSDPNLVVGPIICYELAFDHTIYQTTRHGAQIIVVQSNNATYTGTGQPLSQFAITRARAMELRREVVVATTSSFSGLIDPHGRVQAISREAANASTVFTVPVRTQVTPAVRFGEGIEAGLALAGLAAFLFALAKQTRLRSYGRPNRNS